MVYARKEEEEEEASFLLHWTTGREHWQRCKA